MKHHIVMAREAWDTFWCYTDLMVGEVACFGYAEYDEASKEIYVSEIFIVPQEADKSQVDFISEGLPFAVEKAANDGKLEQLRFCIHSHGEIAATWSKTDEDMVEKMGLTADWFASVIFNRKGARTGRIDWFGDTPFGGVQFTWKDLEVICERDPQWEDQRIAELEAYVRKPAPAPPKTAPGRPTQPTRHDVQAWGTSIGDPSVNGDNLVTLMGATINLDELSGEEIADLVKALEWDWCFDADRNMYLWDDSGTVFYEVQAHRFEEQKQLPAAHAYTEGVG